MDKLAPLSGVKVMGGKNGLVHLRVTLTELR